MQRQLYRKYNYRPLRYSKFNVFVSAEGIIHLYSLMSLREITFDELRCIQINAFNFASRR